MATKIKNKDKAKKTKPSQPNYELLIGIVILALLAAALLTYFMWPEGEEIPDTGVEHKPYVEENAGSRLTDAGEIDKSDAHVVKVIMEDGGEFTMELYPYAAPVTTANFMKLVEEKFYDGLTFHRVIEGFMAQGGAYDPVNQMNDPVDSIKGEFESNGFDNKLSHTRGVVSMARTNDPDSASSQFFICYDDASFLDGEYASFGMVTEGMEVVDSFLSAGTDANDVPLKEVKIKTIEIVK